MRRIGISVCEDRPRHCRNAYGRPRPALCAAAPPCLTRQVLRRAPDVPGGAPGSAALSAIRAADSDGLWSSGGYIHLSKWSTGFPTHRIIGISINQHRRLASWSVIVWRPRSEVMDWFSYTREIARMALRLEATPLAPGVGHVPLPALKENMTPWSVLN